MPHSLPSSAVSPGQVSLRKCYTIKFVLYVPLYRQVNEWMRYGLETNDKNLSNWVIRAAHDWLLPVCDRMKGLMMGKSLLHVDETYGKVIHRSDGKSGQTNAYNWVYRTVPSQGPVMTLFQSALSRARSVLESFIGGFKGTIICDGYSAYGNLPDVQFANCWAHVRRYWLKADSRNGRKGVDFCDQLYRLELRCKHLPPGKRRKQRLKHSKPIVEAFFQWIDTSPFFGKSALAKAADYTLSRTECLRAFLYDGRIEIDNNPAENAICLSLAETAKSNGIDFYEYVKKLLTDLPALGIHQNPEILDQYLPWSKNIQATCAKL